MNSIKNTIAGLALTLLMLSGCTRGEEKQKFAEIEKRLSALELKAAEIKTVSVDANLNAQVEQNTKDINALWLGFKSANHTESNLSVLYDSLDKRITKIELK